MWNMVGISSRWQSMENGRMVVHLSRGAKPRQGANSCHWGEPLVVTENYLLPHAAVLPGTLNCCQHQSCHLHPMLVPEPPLTPVSGTQCRSQSPLRAYPPPPAS
ncbi:unnamed protein product [Pipistrellus nathusii]|uniref:Uncharacterized protein n=1 Tax=Pipistrellus nathusii TaxID=59473 RepID=A0ABN9ZY33_PIPNA